MKDRLLRIIAHLIIYSLMFVLLIMKRQVIKAIATGLLLGAALIAAAALAGCSLTVSPDGSRTYTTEPAAFLQAVEILAEK